MAKAIKIYKEKSANYQEEIVAEQAKELEKNLLIKMNEIFIIQLHKIRKIVTKKFETLLRLQKPAKGNIPNFP